jgi:hypothetical protein
VALHLGLDRDLASRLEDRLAFTPDECDLARTDRGPIIVVDAQSALIDPTRPGPPASHVLPLSPGTYGAGVRFRGLVVTVRGTR